MHLADDPQHNSRAGVRLHRDTHCARVSCKTQLTFRVPVPNRGCSSVRDVTAVFTTPPTEFRPHDSVRLLDHHGNVPSGTRGRIIGRYARSADPTYVVSFEQDNLGVVEVRSDEIVPS
jgi:hypothetical protein